MTARQLVTTRTGLVHLSDCIRLRPIHERWPYTPTNDGPGVSRACRLCLPAGIPDALPAQPCHVSVGLGTRWGQRRCGEPAVGRGLCAKHMAERVRLGGAP